MKLDKDRVKYHETVDVERVYRGYIGVEQMNNLDWYIRIRVGPYKHFDWNRLVATVYGEASAELKATRNYFGRKHDKESARRISTYHDQYV